MWHYAVIGVWLTLLAAWLTHVIHTISNAEWILLLVGAIAAPIGAIHGIGLWFGVW